MVKIFNFWRVNSLLILFLSLLIIITGRLFQLQVLEHEKFSVLAARQHWGFSQIPAARGRILSSDGFPLVENQMAYLVYGEPSNIPDVDSAAKKLADILWEENLKSQMSNVKATSQMSKLDEGNSKEGETQRLLTILGRDLQWVPLAHKISPETKQRIEELEIEGIGFEEEPKRFYPEETLAAHLLGFVGSDERGNDQGYYGLEGFYNGDLRGRPGRIVEEKGASGEPILLGGYKKIPAENGRDLVLTLDRSVQFLVEQKLAAAVEKYGAESGSVVVMEPGSGMILAMANFPNYDPLNPSKDLESDVDDVGRDAPSGRLYDDNDKQRWTNPAISETYEPGSVLKALTMSAAIDTKTVKPQTTMQDNGPITVSGYTIDNWDGKHHGEETMIEILQHSNNCGAAWVGQQLGAETLRNYFLKFGLGEVSGVDLEDEDTGIVKELSEWRPIDLANAAFGQGVSMTPLQLVSIFSTIVNEGVMMKPYLVDEIHEGDKIIKTKPRQLTRVLSEQSAEIMKEMLTAAVEGGESKFYNLKTHRVAGKTGTAQIPVEGRYDPTKTNCTFVGFLPSYPEFVMLVLLRQPSASVYAAETAVPTWMEIARELTVYYSIEPDK